MNNPQDSQEDEYLDRTDQYTVDSFNRNINRLNAMNGSLQAMVDDYNRDVDAFNAELERVGTPLTKFLWQFSQKGRIFETPTR